MSNSKFLNNFIWRLAEQWGAKIVTLVVAIVLARLLEPSAFGQIALITVLTTILQVFVDSGLGTALIQKKDSDDLDFSSVFWFNLIICFLLYLLMFICAPYIAVYYNMPEIVPVIRVLSLIIVISGIKSIQLAYVSKNLIFRKFFFATLGGTVIAAIVGIWMAYNGYGVWALVAQNLINNLIDTLILWFTVRWHPKMMFSFERFKNLYSYGYKMLLSSLIDTIYNELRSLVIGKYYSSADLAFYTKGSQFPRAAVANINNSMNSVLLPVLSEKQDNIEEVKNAARKVIKTSSFFIWPMMLGLFAVSHNFILLLLTEKWLPCVEYLRILCIGQALQPLQTTNLSVIKALGRADLHLKLEIIKKTIAISLIIISTPYGVRMIAYSSLLYAIIASVLNSFPNRKLINYSYFEQVIDISPSFLLSVFMCLCMLLLEKFDISPIYVFILQIIVGMSVYLILAYVLKVDEINYLVNKIKGFLKK